MYVDTERELIKGNLRSESVFGVAGILYIFWGFGSYNHERPVWRGDKSDGNSMWWTAGGEG